MAVGHDGVVALTYDGKVLWAKEAELSDSGGPLIVDLDDDGELDVVAAGAGGLGAPGDVLVYAWKGRTGDILPGFPIEVDGRVVAPLTYVALSKAHAEKVRSASPKQEAPEQKESGGDAAGTAGQQSEQEAGANGIQVEEEDESGGYEPVQRRRLAAAGMDAATAAAAAAAAQRHGAQFGDHESQLGRLMKSIGNPAPLYVIVPTTTGKVYFLGYHDTKPKVFSPTDKHKIEWLEGDPTTLPQDILDQLKTRRGLDLASNDPIWEQDDDKKEKAGQEQKQKQKQERGQEQGQEEHGSTSRHEQGVRSPAAPGSESSASLWSVSAIPLLAGEGGREERQRRTPGAGSVHDPGEDAERSEGNEPAAASTTAPQTPTAAAAAAPGPTRRPSSPGRACSPRKRQRVMAAPHSAAAPAAVAVPAAAAAAHAPPAVPSSGTTPSGLQPRSLRGGGGGAFVPLPPRAARAAPSRTEAAPIAGTAAAVPTAAPTAAAPFPLHRSPAGTPSLGSGLGRGRRPTEQAHAAFLRSLVLPPDHHANGDRNGPAFPCFVPVAVLFTSAAWATAFLKFSPGAVSCLVHPLR